MKRDDLKKIEGLSEAAIDAIMALAGQDAESHKTASGKLQSDLDQVKAQVEGLNTQLTEASKQIESFKGMDIDGVKKAAADWQAKAEQAQKDAQAQLSALKFDHALEGALSAAKPRNLKAVKALLDANGLKLNEADGSILGLKEQLEKIQTENAFLFEASAADPKIVDHAAGKATTPTDSFLAAVYRGAGIKKD